MIKRCVLSAVALLAFSAGQAAEVPASQPTPEAVMAELRAANAARAQRLSEEQDWAKEKQRLELLEDTIAREAKRLEQAATELEQRTRGLQQEVAQAQAQQGKQVNLGLMFERLAERTEEELRQLARQTPPGLVPAIQPPDSPRPEARFLAALRRLEQTERQTKNSTVELVEGSLGGKTETVKLLRIGGVAAWWIALDGRRAGPARRNAGELTLLPGAPEDLRAIARALAIVEGSAAPDWVVLPCETLRGKE